MAFPQQTPRVFTQVIIEELNPNQTGVYGIYRDGAWIYVGRGDIRARLLAHLNGDNPRITKEKPTAYVTEVTPNDETREKALIVELDPIANRKVG